MSKRILDRCPIPILSFASVRITDPKDCRSETDIFVSIAHQGHTKTKTAVCDSLLSVRKLLKRLVPRAGVEPARPLGQRILSPSRLPFRHPGTAGKITCQ